jgi:hypothetical protein
MCVFVSFECGLIFERKAQNFVVCQNSTTPHHTASAAKVSTHLDGAGVLWPEACNVRVFAVLTIG